MDKVVRRAARHRSQFVALLTAVSDALSRRVATYVLHAQPTVATYLSATVNSICVFIVIIKAVDLLEGINDTINVGATKV